MGSVGEQRVRPQQPVGPQPIGQEKLVLASADLLVVGVLRQVQVDAHVVLVGQVAQFVERVVSQ